jgi:large subunit ribosomal protein L31
MKQNLHPKWTHEAKVTCSCGNVFTTGSQQDEITVDICSNCHPFYTGEMRFVDRQGRVDRFMQKVSVAQQKQAAKKSKKATDQTDVVEETKEEPMSYKQLLQNEQTRLKTASKPAAKKAA